MKVAKCINLQNRQRWEETQIFQLSQIFENIKRYQENIFFQIKVALNLVIFLVYKLIQYVCWLVQVLLFTPASIRANSDEQWLYRQIK